MSGAQARGPIIGGLLPAPAGQVWDRVAGGVEAEAPKGASSEWQLGGNVAPTNSRKREGRMTDRIRVLERETPNSRKQPQQPAQNHNPRVGGSSPSSGIAPRSEMRRPQGGVFVPRGN